MIASSNSSHLTLEFKCNSFVQLCEFRWPLHYKSYSYRLIFNTFTYLWYDVCAYIGIKEVDNFTNLILSFYVHLSFLCRVYQTTGTCFDMYKWKLWQVKDVISLIEAQWHHMVWKNSVITGSVMVCRLPHGKMRLNQYWLAVNRKPRNKLQWNLSHNIIFFANKCIWICHQQYGRPLIQTSKC